MRSILVIALVAFPAFGWATAFDLGIDVSLEHESRSEDVDADDPAVSSLMRTGLGLRLAGFVFDPRFLKLRASINAALVDGESEIGDRKSERRYETLGYGLGLTAFSSRPVRFGLNVSSTTRESSSVGSPPIGRDGTLQRNQGWVEFSKKGLPALSLRYDGSEFDSDQSDALISEKQTRLEFGASYSRPWHVTDLEIVRSDEESYGGLVQRRLNEATFRTRLWPFGGRFASTLQASRYEGSDSESRISALFGTASYQRSVLGGSGSAGLGFQQSGEGDGRGRAISVSADYNRDLLEWMRIAGEIGYLDSQLGSRDLSQLTATVTPTAWGRWKGWALSGSPSFVFRLDEGEQSDRDELNLGLRAQAIRTALTWSLRVRASHSRGDVSLRRPDESGLGGGATVLTGLVSGRSNLAVNGNWRGRRWLTVSGSLDLSLVDRVTAQEETSIQSQSLRLTGRSGPVWVTLVAQELRSTGAFQETNTSTRELTVHARLRRWLSTDLKYGTRSVDVDSVSSKASLVQAGLNLSYAQLRVYVRYVQRIDELTTGLERRDQRVFAGFERRFDFSFGRLEW